MSPPKNPDAFESVFAFFAGATEVVELVEDGGSEVPVFDDCEVVVVIGDTVEDGEVEAGEGRVVEVDDVVVVEDVVVVVEVDELVVLEDDVDVEVDTSVAVTVMLKY